MNKKHNLLVFITVIAILFLGAYFRFYNLDWDQGNHLHPDERFLTMVGDKIKWPQDIREYFNTGNSPLNPYNQGYSFFVYGTLPLFLVKKIAIVLKKDSYDQFNLLGRQISALFDLGTLILIGFISKKTIKKSIGWMDKLVTWIIVWGAAASIFGLSRTKKWKKVSEKLLDFWKDTGKKWINTFWKMTVGILKIFSKK